MLVVLSIHFIAIAISAFVGSQSNIRTALWVAAVAPAASTIWALQTLLSDGETPSAEVTWVNGLDIGFVFEADDLALMMTLLVSGIGALIFVYAVGYFDNDAAGGGRFPASLLAFSTSMLGLVWADSIWTLFIFWELTSVTSFLLVGHKNTYPEVQTAARRALMITGAGGLALLAGLLILADAAGTSELDGLTSVGGTSATVAAALILVGAATKSAQVPFHVWLPGAMAAPTPVSAYLHSATMVKAGIFLVALVGPAFGDVQLWKVLGLAFGITSMIWGAVGALRHLDAKLILAWGTVSQLGLLMVLLSLGTAKGTFAAISMLFAHAVFKAALFAAVGEIDVRTGTRDIGKLSSLHNKMPITATVMVVAGLSMAGVPPFLGFATKEAAVEAALKLSGAEFVVAGLAIIGGSVLTVAYTVRLLIGLLGPGPDIEVAPRRAPMTFAVSFLGSLSVLGFIALNVVNALVEPAAIQLNPEASVYTLKRWPGITEAFLTSLGIVISGVITGVALSKVHRAIPKPVGANAADASLDGILDFAPRFIKRVQHGSLPVYLTTMVIVVVCVSTFFLPGFSTSHVVLWDTPTQGALSLLVVLAAMGGGLVRSRLGAALALGAIGIGVSGVFVAQGAPDLALTQLLVETVIVVGFVIGLGRLSTEFPSSTGSWKLIRGVVSIGAGAAVVIGLIAASSSPVGSPPIDELTNEAVEVGGGKNVVNVILTDVRALDTLGEVMVIAIVAIGILALAKAPRPERASS